MLPWTQELFSCDLVSKAHPRRYLFSSPPRTLPPATCTGASDALCCVEELGVFFMYRGPVQQPQAALCPVLHLDHQSSPRTYPHCDFVMPAEERGRFAAVCCQLGLLMIDIGHLYSLGRQAVNLVNVGREVRVLP